MKFNTNGKFLVKYKRTAVAFQTPPQPWDKLPYYLYFSFHVLLLLKGMYMYM